MAVDHKGDTTRPFQHMNFRPPEHQRIFGLGVLTLPLFPGAAADRCGVAPTCRAPLQAVETLAVDGRHIAGSPLAIDESGHRAVPIGWAEVDEAQDFGDQLGIAFAVIRVPLFRRLDLSREPSGSAKVDRKVILFLAPKFHRFLQNLDFYCLPTEKALQLANLLPQTPSFGGRNDVIAGPHRIAASSSSGFSNETRW